MFCLAVFSFLFMANFATASILPKPSKGRIVGGRDTDITEIPYQVSVRHQNNHKCGGSIIGPKHILTAAHCVEKKDPTLFSIRAGSSYYFKGGQRIDVIEVINHPNYNTDIIDYDAAILVLKEPLKSGDGVRIATLASVEPKEGDMVLISGWGLLGKNGRPSEFLQSVSVPVVSKKICKEKYRGEAIITKQMFCAGHTTEGKDCCEGDSGGPAMVNGKLAGIVSWGDDCGNQKYPGVYTNIVSILPWISVYIQG